MTPLPVTWHNCRIGAKVYFVKGDVTHRGIISKLGRKTITIELGRGSLVKRRYGECYFDKE